MNHSLPMRFIERIGDLDAELHLLIKWQRSALQALGERLAFEKFHDEVIRAVLLADVIQRAYMRMIQRSDRLHFPLEAGPRLGLRGDLRRKNLDRHRPMKPRVT